MSLPAATFTSRFVPRFASWWNRLDNKDGWNATMLRLLGNRKVLCDGLTRRDLLHIGGLGAFGIALARRPGPGSNTIRRCKPCSKVRARQVVHLDLQVRFASAA